MGDPINEVSPMIIGLEPSTPELVNGFHFQEPWGIYIYIFIHIPETEMREKLTRGYLDMYLYPSPYGIFLLTNGRSIMGLSPMSGHLPSEFNVGTSTMSFPASRTLSPHTFLVGFWIPGKYGCHWGSSLGVHHSPFRSRPWEGHLFFRCPPCLSSHLCWSLHRQRLSWGETNTECIGEAGPNGTV